MNKNTKKKLVWRLGNLPTIEELRDLVVHDILTKDEAREILFTNEEVEDRDTKSLKEEIKFLRSLVEKLSNFTNTKIFETIKIVEKPYYEKPWYEPYTTWGDSINAPFAGASGSTNCSSTYMIPAFSSIKTF